MEVVKEYRLLTTTKRGPYEFGTYDSFEKAHAAMEAIMTTMDEKYAEEIEVRIEERVVGVWMVCRD